VTVVPWVTFDAVLRIIGLKYLHYNHYIRLKNIMSITLLYSIVCCVMIYNKKNVAAEMSDAIQAAEAAPVRPPMV
jgi:hypothetical protein